MSGTEQEEGGVWPPPPEKSPSEETGPPPKPPRVTDQGIGRASLGLSGLGSLCAPACVLSLVTDPNGHWPSLWTVLLIGSGGGFFAGFFVGFVGWHSWEGKVGLSLAVFSALLVALLVAVTHSP